MCLFFFWPLGEQDRVCATSARRVPPISFPRVYLVAHIGSHLFDASRQQDLVLCRLALHLDVRLAVSRRKESLAINPVARPAIWGEKGGVDDEPHARPAV